MTGWLNGTLLAGRTAKEILLAEQYKTHILKKKSIRRNIKQIVNVGTS